MVATPVQALFVAMPFREEYERVLTVVKDAARLLNMRVVQVGEEPFAGSIISHIRSEIEAADVMVAIVSEVNGNVYYEIGLAHCQSKPVVLLTSDADALRFDLRDHRALIYDEHRPEGIRDELLRTLKATIDTPRDPTAFLASTYGGTQDDPDPTSDRGLKKAVDTIASQADLHEPVTIRQVQLRERTRDLAIEVEDFMGTIVRAIVDMNGLIRVMKHM